MQQRQFIFIILALILAMPFVSAQTVSKKGQFLESENFKQSLRDLKAFPGAEGFGAATTGGRGGKVLYVTRLDDDDKPGSLRWAINQSGKRVILFQTAGIIALKSDLIITNGNLTLTGQSAPGDGICISNYPVLVRTDNIIIRYMRFRLGDEKQQEADALGGANHKDIIIDHCSTSWSTDECASFFNNENFTMQWCILSESLRISAHHKGTHGYGGIWGGFGASFHHNLLANHDSRNPRFCASYTDQPEKVLVDFRNNVIFNWGINSGYAGEGGCYNIVNNYYKPGEAAKLKTEGRIFEPFPNNGLWGNFYVSGNYMLNKDGTPNDTVNTDNWVGIHPKTAEKDKAELKSSTQFAVADVTTQTAQEAYDLVLQQAGASLRRDATDTRVTNEVRNGLTPIRAYYTLHPDEKPDGISATKAGMIDSQKDVGGWDTYTCLPNEIPVDTDGDGIPDEWEIANGLNPRKASDGASISLSGTYTNLEVYLYSLTLNNKNDNK
jgi:hypothetical protein